MRAQVRCTAARRRARSAPYAQPTRDGSTFARRVPAVLSRADHARCARGESLCLGAPETVGRLAAARGARSSALRRGARSCKKPLDGGELYLQRISKWLRLCADGASQNSPKHEVPCEGRDFRRMRETSGDLFRRACAGDRMSMSSLSRFRGDVPVQFRPQPGCRQGRRRQR
jgi:hypothetical protein